MDKKGRKLKDHHHITLDQEFRLDAEMWLEFLINSDKQEMCRPFVDQDIFSTSHTLNFYTDASGVIGFGCIFNNSWTFGTWEKSFLKTCKLSIEYLELFALCVGIFTWGQHISNTRVVIFCDNKAVMEMINQTTSGCRNCMVLIWLLVLNNLKYNRRVFVKYVKSADNILADSTKQRKFQ